jgi:hypothetical protein
MSFVPVTANFPVPKLSVIASHDVPPTYATIRIAQKELNSNAASVHSHGGGGRHGLLTLTVSPAEYIALTGVPFLPPPVPPPQPIIPANARATQINEAIRQHSEDQRIFQQYHDTDKALVKLILEALPRTYVEALEDDSIGFANVTCRDLLTHLYSEYGTISLSDRDNNQRRMNAPWNPPTPISELFKQINDGMTFAAAAGEPITDTQASRLTYNLINQTGFFNEACREWRLRDPANQTFAELQIFFRRMDRDRLQTSTILSEGIAASITTSSTSNDKPQATIFEVSPCTSLPQANNIHQPIEAPATATLVTEIRELISTIKSFKTHINERQQFLKNDIEQPTTKRNRTTSRSYCWTHGCTHNPYHTSKTCVNRAEGHQVAATYDNKLGGSNYSSTYNKRSRTH